MEATRRFLARMGLPSREANDLPTSAKRFPDGSQFRIEIPSVEGPAVMAETLAEAGRKGITVHRVSQGSGAMLLTDAEIREMAELGREKQCEVSLFVGPRSTWDIGAFNRSEQGKALAYRHRGIEQIVYAIEDIKRATIRGIRGVLVADEGLLMVANEMKKAGELPSDLVLKISIRMAHGNPASMRVLEQLGANSINVIGDLTLAQLASIRQAIDTPIDMYVEHADAFGSIARYYEIPEIIRVASPVYVKCGTMNSPGLYPSGKHLEDVAKKVTIERIHRAAITMELINQYYPDAIMSKRGADRGSLGIPVLRTAPQVVS